MLIVGQAIVIGIAAALGFLTFLAILFIVMYGVATVIDLVERP